MLLYNQRKEFIGIDNDDLSILGFNDINELLEESADFADFFIKKPGFIHNFKNFSWIDFILHSETEESKAIIYANDKSFGCTLHVTPFNFTSDERGYLILLKNLKQLKGAEGAHVVNELKSEAKTKDSSALRRDDLKQQNIKPIDKSIEQKEPAFPSFPQESTQDLYEANPLEVPDSAENEIEHLTENEFGAPTGIDYNAPLTLDDDVMSETVDEMPYQDESSKEETAVDNEFIQKNETPMLGDYVTTQQDNEHLSELVSSGTYIYNPQVAADELGLPVDLIEEFIGDFIEQAHDFHDDLYASLKSEDFDNVQILSHKLKGVAANLRVEDAFDTLSIINTSKQIDEVLANLNQFYKIIAKLEGKEVIEDLSQVKHEVEIDIKQPDEGPLLVDDTITQMNNSIYQDTLNQEVENNSPEEEKFNASEIESENSFGSAPEDIQNETLQDNDIYENLLNNAEEKKIQSTDEPLDTTYENEDIYTDFLTTQDSGKNEAETYEGNTLPAMQSEEDDIYNNILNPPSNEEEPYLNNSTDDQFLSVPQNDLQDQSTTNQEELLNTPQDENDDIYNGILNVELNEQELSLSGATNTNGIDEGTQENSSSYKKLNYNIEHSANELGIPLELVQEFIQEFKEQMKTYKNDFDTAIANQNIQEINATATLLKGMSDNLRLDEISKLLRDIQKESDINKIVPLLATLQEYVDQL